MGAARAAGIAAVLGVVLAALPALAAGPSVRDTTALRVCADPSSLPFSNTAGEGFENKLAEMVAAELGVPVRYTWYPQSVGFVRNTLGALRCDVIMGMTTASELVQNTNPYYHSVYALVYRRESGLSARTLGDPQLDGKRIGVIAGTPPASQLAALGRLASLQPYHLVVDTRAESPGQQMIDDVAQGKTDAAVAWGPVAGYFAKRHGDALTVVPLTAETGGTRLDFRVTLGVRNGDDEWKKTLNTVLAKLQPRIDALLTEYGVPLLDEAAELSHTQ
ncbi:substrate-binding domain-containing protein [Azospirillum sp.]|uniref:substrate-binding domain-containing protein n=1 Tax=Azospirillum sp. TaxID=34012 RepID=UPI003D71F534